MSTFEVSPSTNRSCWRNLCVPSDLETLQGIPKELLTYVYIHPSIHFRVVGELEPIPDTMGQEAGYTLARSPACYRALSSLASEIYTFVYSKWALSLLGSATPWEIKQRNKLALWSLPFSALRCLPQGRLSLKEDWAPWKQLSWGPEIVHIHNSWQNPTSCKTPENVEKHSLENICVLDIKMWMTTVKKIQIAQTFGNDLTCPRKRCPLSAESINSHFPFYPPQLKWSLMALSSRLTAQV